MVPTDCEFVAGIFEATSGFAERAPVEWDPYNLPYRFAPSPKSVLVLGAGTGNDVAAALRNGAQQVTAVEIDPLILKLGRQLHFEKPYDSPRVTVVVDDARSYIQNSHEQFDLIVFSLLDSHTTSSNFSNIRIDNYVYTVEAMTAATEAAAAGRPICGQIPGGQSVDWRTTARIADDGVWPDAAANPVGGAVRNAGEIFSGWITAKIEPTR